MATLFQNDWSLLWTPNADELNGDPRGLIRCDNLVVEEDKSISLIRGTELMTLGSFHQPVPPAWVSSGPVVQLYSKIFDLKNRFGVPPHYQDDAYYAKVRYVVAGDKILRNWSQTYYSDPPNPPYTLNSIVYDWVIIDNANPQNVAGFGYGWGHVFISYGEHNMKDDGVRVTPNGMYPAQNVFNVTPQTAPPIKLSRILGVSPWSETYAHWEPTVEGTSGMTGTVQYVEFYGKDVALGSGSTSEFLCSIIVGVNNPVVVDATEFPLIYDPNFYQTGSDTPDDIFSMSVRIGDTTRLKYVTFTFFLLDPTSTGYAPDAKDYYQFEWRPETSAFIPGVNAWQNLKCKRKEFTRQGDDPNLTWKNIRGMKLNIGFTENPMGQPCVLTNLYFQGSAVGTLHGTYEYIQVDVDNNGYFLDKSPAGPSTKGISIEGGYFYVKPSTVNIFANQCWIFRRGGQLNDFYRVSVQQGDYGFDPPAFNDVMSDETALLENIRLDSFQTNLPSHIIGMECNWKGRNWYLDERSIYPSYFDNPCYYDSRWQINTAAYGQVAESNLFLTRLTNDTMVLATTKDFYEITGTGGIIQQDGIEFFDITIRPLGINSPSISPSFVVREGNLFYMAADGIRILQGSSCTLFSVGIDMMFKDYNRYGISPVSIKTHLKERYYMGIARNRFYITVPKQDKNRCIFVYSFEDKNWRYEDHGAMDEALQRPVRDSPHALWVEEDEKIIYGTSSFGDGQIRQLDVNQSVLVSGSDYSKVGLVFSTEPWVGTKEPIPFRFISIWDANQQPRNRKDSYTFKIHLNTYGEPVTLKLWGAVGINESGANDLVTSFTQVVGTNGPQELCFQIYPTIGLTKYYKLEITGSARYFKLWNWSVDYEPRPEQLTSLLIKPDNYGIAGRKRINAINFMIDPMKYDFTFTPTLDGVPQEAQTFSYFTKTLVSYQFKENKAAYNVGGLLSGGPFEFYGLVPPREHELLPDSLKYKWIPYTNLGSGARKRFIQYAITVDTRGEDVTMTPIIDDVRQPSMIINSTVIGSNPLESRKKTFIYTFDTFAVGIDIACELKAPVNTIWGFEFYEVNLQECMTEKLPPLAETTHIPYTNFGTSARKRVRQFALVIDTFDANVDFTPYVDGIPQEGLTIHTSRKQTVIIPTQYFAVGVDFGGLLRADFGTNFEFYGVAFEECVYEKLPPLACFLHIADTNFETTSRKRIQQYAFVIDTRGNTVKFQPYIEGLPYGAPLTFSTNSKDTVIYTYPGFAIGVDIGGTLESPYGPFEFYGLNLEACVYEKLPPLAESLHIAYTNFNTTSRKKMGQYAFVIDTFGQAVKFTPFIDGSTAGDPHIFATTRKETVVYTYSNSAIGVDVGGLLESVNGTDFEFYGVALDNAVYEKLPPKIQYMELPCMNFGIAARKRIRTIPIVLNTFGHDVTYIPRVDGVEYPSSVFNTNDKSTVLHYFTDDGKGTPFGIDYCGTLKGDYDFEFYEVLKPENVETLPVGKKFDQFGPIEFNKIGKIREISIRMVHTGEEFYFAIYASDNRILNGKVLTIPNMERCYVISCPKGINPNIFRMELSSDQVFHRFNCSVKVNIDGSQTQNQWVKIK